MSSIIQGATKKIVLLAGKDSHGPGAHEFRAGCHLLKKKLHEAMPGKLEIIVVEEVFPSEAILKGADALVVYSDGLGRHPVNNHFETLDKYVSKGMGIAFMHFACDVPPGDKGDFFKKWIGGHYETKFSTNPHWVCHSQYKKGHPVVTGCKEFSLNDEWYYNIRFDAKLPVQHVLKGTPDDEARSGKTSSPRGPYPHIVKASGNAETLLWTVEREDGGRGFGFTGGHFHANWKNDDYRKMILNAIVWLTKENVPKEGLVSKTPTEDEMNHLMQSKVKKPKAKKQTKGIGPKGKALYQSPVITSKSKSRTVNIDIDIKGKKSLYLVGGDGGNGISFDHVAWGNPRLTGPKGELNLTDIKWRSATQGYGKTRIGQSVDGRPVTMAGKVYEKGIGSHSTSIIVYDLPKGYDRFKAIAGMDDEVTNGEAAVHFAIYDSKPTMTAAPASADEVAVTSVPVEDFSVLDDLEIKVWATSPMFYNPTNMDIDSKGRIWVAEGVNYRNFRKPKIDIKHPKGDRIMVLEDTNGDGKADKSHVFVQDIELVAPLGVSVIGNKVIVAQPPSLLVYNDVNGDAVFDPAVDKKEVFLTGFSGLDHDHSLHSVTFGPDGEYYFNQGNAGASIVTDKSGFTVRAGSSYKGGSPNVTSNQPGLVSDDGHIYVGGFACRVKTDGTGLTVIGHNFRNSYEQTVTSFGDVFQNDNDDPPANRTTWLMEYGNLGFSSADGSRKWQADKRPGQSTQVAEWRQEDPGTIPAGDVYGSGAPTGIAYYENGALPEKYNGMLITCDSAINVLYGYYPSVNGAGYDLNHFNFLTSKKEGASGSSKWFRPSDVTVGPDGAIYVADWFDPGVGGHAMRDRTGSGTIYRVAAKGFKSVVPEINLKTVDGMIEALKSPAVNVRSLGFTKLIEQGPFALPALKELLNDSNPSFQARAIWVLSQIGDQGKKVVEGLLKTGNAKLRVVAYRALRRQKWKFFDISKQLASDPSAAVRREVALAMRNESFENSSAILLELAKSYNGSDRWALEAIGTGCTGKEAEMFDLFKRHLGTGALAWSDAFADLAWRLHLPESVGDFQMRAKSVDISIEERTRALTAIGFVADKSAALAMLDIAKTGPADIKELAAWWVKNKHSSSWKSFNLVSQLAAPKGEPKKTLDLAKHVTKASAKFPSVKKLAKMKGDPAKGKALFYSSGICFSCHKVDGNGRDVGPDLSAIGEKFDTATILDQMVNPSSEIGFGYESTIIETKDGKTFQGFVVSDADPIVVRDLGGNDHSIEKKNIKKREMMKESIMPSVKNLGLSAQDVADIASYLTKGK